MITITVFKASEVAGPCPVVPLHQVKELQAEITTAQTREAELRRALELTVAIEKADAEATSFKVASGRGSRKFDTEYAEWERLQNVVMDLNAKFREMRTTALTNASAGPGWRLLWPNEPIEEGDQLLRDDCVTWETMSKANNHNLFVGCKWNPTLFVPMRTTRPAPNQEPEKE